MDNPSKRDRKALREYLSRKAELDGAALMNAEAEDHARQQGHLTTKLLLRIIAILVVPLLMMLMARSSHL
jgi:hypothetical protein